MLYRFFEDTLAGRFIKHLLRAEPIPRFKIIQDEDYLIPGRCYLYNGLIIKCLEAGHFKHDPTDNLYPSDNLYPTMKLFPGANPISNLTLATYKVLRYYDPADPTVQYNYHSKYLWHDSDTHYHLGEYLRYLKLEKGIDLLPYYNCFNYKSTINLEIPHGKKYLLVPVKFNRNYTIALNSPNAFKISKVLYNEFLGKYSPEDFDKGVKYTNSVFNKPFIFSTGNAPLELEDNKSETQEVRTALVESFHEKDLHLLIELDSTNDTGIVVLEGDYTNSNKNIVTSYSYTSRPLQLSLLLVDNGVSYAFSSRLIEYLLLHVISEYDIISDNIKRVQEQLVRLDIIDRTTNKQIFADYKDALDSGRARYGLWDDSLQAKIRIYIDYLLDKGHPLVDQDGNVNSQLEEYLRKGVT